MKRNLFTWSRPGSLSTAACVAGFFEQSEGPATCVPSRS